MSEPQPGILAPVPSLSRYLEFGTLTDADIASVLQALAAEPLDENVVIGLGPGLTAGLGGDIDGLRPFPAISGPGCEVPSTQADLWIWLRGSDRGEITHRGRALTKILSPAFRAPLVDDGFKYGDGRDLSGYIDGTENPEGDDAVEAAITSDGSSFVAVQKWAHDLDHFATMTVAARDDIIGRHISNNEEFDAPDSAHVKRTAQESFDPEAFVVRRSMPWADGSGEGLVFVAFGNTLDSFEVQLRRMTGQEDGLLDGLFHFTRPITGSYFWCPPIKGGKLDLSALGL